jgi:23S rRNA pseudouridine2605 synthase
MTEHHEHEAEPLEEDITSEADDLNPDGTPHETDEELVATSSQIFEAGSEAGQAGLTEKDEDESVAAARPAPRRKRSKKAVPAQDETSPVLDPPTSRQVATASSEAGQAGLTEKEPDESLAAARPAPRRRRSRKAVPAQDETPPELDPATSQQVAEASTEAGQAGAVSEEEPENTSRPASKPISQETGPGLPAGKLERLQKILAQAGIASRRHAEELITQGRVQVNGQVVTVLGSKADPTRDHIRVDGKLIHGAERHRYFMLNKPRGYVTTVTDPEGRPTVMELFSKMGERLYPIGRLDYQSEGLLLVTNDGELANALTRAANGVEKTYLVKVSGRPDEQALDRLREGGVTIERGLQGEGKVRTAPARIRQIRPGANPWYEVVLIEGRNRELRKMFEEIGHHVEKIRRVAYGPLVLDLEPGKLRELDPEEVNALRLAAEGKLKPRRLKTSAMLPKEAGQPAEQRDRGFRPGQRGGKPFRRDDRPRHGNRGTEDRGYAARRESRPPRWQDRPPERPQDRQFRTESGFQRHSGGRPGSRPGRFAAGQRSYRTGPPPEERSRFEGRPPRTGVPNDRSSSIGRRADRPRRREESFEGQERPRKPFHPRGERPSIERRQSEQTGDRESRYGKRAESTGRDFKGGPGRQSSGRNFEKPPARDRNRGARGTHDRPPRREGSAPVRHGSDRSGQENKQRPTGSGRSSSAHGSNSRNNGSRPRSGHTGRSSGGPKRDGRRPGPPGRGGPGPGGPGGRRGRS